MNISILLNSVEIVNKVLSYTRTLDICSGIGTLELVAQYENDFSVDPWDMVEVYEDGDKVGEFYVSMFDKSHDSGEKKVSCQDGSKRLVDWFIDDTYSLTYPTTAKYWIEKFLTDAGVTYTINAAGSGGILSENSSLGATSAYDAIQGLLQMSGWYMYFDPNGTCIIDTLSKDLSENLYTVTDNVILQIEIKKSDKDLRNKAVVWGNYSGGSWAFASRQLKTGYETSEYDWRAVVLSNSTIYSSGTAASLAIKLLNEFSTLSVEKVVTLAGYHPVTIGDVLNVDSNYYTGAGLITNVQITVDPSSGVKTILTLDVRCPRLFAYYGFITWVYTGTQGSGVWRKRLDSATWQDYSTGLLHYNVTDLMIKNNVFACVADGHVYVNLSHYTANWQAFSPGTLLDSSAVEFTSSETEAVKIDIDDTNNWISIGYQLTGSAIATLGENRAWTVIIDPKRNIKATYPVSISTTGVTNLNLTDVEKYAGRDLVAVMVSGGAPLDPSLDSTWGYKRTHPLGIRDWESNIYSTANDGVTYSGTDIIQGPTLNNNAFQDTIFYGRTSISFDPATFQYTAWSGDTPFILTVPVPAFTLPAGHSYLDLSVYWKDENDGLGVPRADEDRHYVVNYLSGDYSPYDVKFTSRTFTPVLSGYPYRLSDAICAADAQTPLFGIYDIDGVTPTPGDRILVTNQTDATENGTYVAGMGAWARTLDVLNRCATVVVTTGDTYAESIWQVVTQDPIIDTTAIEIKQVLIPNTVVNNYTIATSASFPIMNINYTPLIINGVYYWLFFTQNTSFTYPKTYASKMFKYNCETAAYSTSTDLSYTANYANIYSVLADITPCGTGVCAILMERKLPKGGATVEDAFLETDSFFKIHFIYHTESSSSILTNTVLTSTVHDFTENICYMDQAWRVSTRVMRNQGCKIGNDGKYHPYYKFSLYLGRVEQHRKEDSLGNCLEDCPPVTLNNTVSQKRLIILVYDVYSGTIIVQEETETIYEFGQTATLYPDCIFPEEDYAWEFTLFNDNFDNTEYNHMVFDSEDNAPIYSKISYPIYVVDSTTVMKGDTKGTELYTLTHPNKIVSQIADDDGYLYIADPAVLKVYKEHHLGGIDSTFILPTAPTYDDNFAYTNELLVFNDAIEALNYGIEYWQRNSRIYKLSDSIIVTTSGLGTAYILERNDSNTFDIIDTDDYALNLEASVDWPLISRTYGERIGDSTATPHFRVFTSYPSYIEGDGLLADARGWYAGGDVMTFETGEVELEYNKYGLVLTSGGVLQIVDTSVLTNADTRYSIYTLSGTHLATETSNRYFPNYIFVSSENSFFQRNPLYNTTFLNHSSGMPMDYINIIRLDDRV